MIPISFRVTSMELSWSVDVQRQNHLGHSRNSPLAPKLLWALVSNHTIAKPIHFISDFYWIALASSCATARSFVCQALPWISVEHPNHCRCCNSTNAGPIRSILSFMLSWPAGVQWHDQWPTGPVRAFPQSVTQFIVDGFWCFVFTDQRHRWRTR